MAADCDANAIRPDSLPPVCVRGIYATALSVLLLNRGFPLADPSPAIVQRLRLPRSGAAPSVSISDRSDRHGVVIVGETAAVENSVDFLFRAIPMSIRVRQPTRTSLVFTARGKAFLDEQRALVVPTALSHHLLKANGISGSIRSSRG